jgi:hypothetical protein
MLLKHAYVGLVLTITKHLKFVQKNVTNVNLV